MSQKRIQIPIQTQKQTEKLSITLATRIHLGQQSTPPSQAKLTRSLATFLETAHHIKAKRTVIAIDPAPKIKYYDLYSSIQSALIQARKVAKEELDPWDSDPTAGQVGCTLLKVTPWGNFVPALNALTSWACVNQYNHIDEEEDNVIRMNNYGHDDTDDDNDNVPEKSIIMFISAETSVTGESVQVLGRHMTDDTLVVGAALPGHDYHQYSKSKSSSALPSTTSAAASASGPFSTMIEALEVPLNGRTCPWNTLAMWDLNKLALMGFPLCADGIHTLLNDDAPLGQDGKRTRTLVAGGIEEFATILLHQRNSGSGNGHGSGDGDNSGDNSGSNAKAKLVRVEGVAWEQEFEDEARRKWHENKMKSKESRAEVHRMLLGGGKAGAGGSEGVVYHCSGRIGYSALMH
eukprot:CAMPEP_0194095502 /NCGR_PEP_ID=MMETSP0149-20130528/56860_1 /TAXON_ID=122233 /ORGANISM="Chaetoceros debilis, Strain MM31A-1" /LENGTH=404 /DNA_ID=CAMNT_0038781447 /DNA_START=805 /DNA_END=2019 /DNA_ORIENTATION=-